MRPLHHARNGQFRRPCRTEGCTGLAEPRQDQCLGCQLGKGMVDLYPEPVRVVPTVAPLRVRCVCLTCAREYRAPGRCPACSGRVFAEALPGGTAV